ncbi:MAG: DUF6798 domain-containing protein [Planctomycetota bacterium]
MDAGPPPQPTLIIRLAEVALITAVFWIEGGAPAPHVNETYYLVKAQHYWDPGFCAGNRFLESADAHETFYWSVGWLAQWVSLPAAAWIGRGLCWSLLAFAWQRLSWGVAPVRFASVLSAALMVSLVGQLHFAGEWVVGGVESKCFAYPLVMLGLHWIAENKWNRVWPALGLAGAFHPLVGGWSVLAAGCVWLTEPADSRPALRGMAPWIVLGGVLSLPGLWPALRLNAGVSPEVAREAARIYVFDRLAHHLAPLSKPGFWILDRAARHAVMIVLFVVAWQWLKPRAAAQGLERVCRFAAATLLFSAAGLAWETATAGDETLAASLLRYYPFRMADVALPVAVALAAPAVLVAVDRRTRYTAPATVLLCLLPAWHFSSVVATRLVDPTAPADRGVLLPDDWVDVCRWTRENTPPDAVFLGPRSGQSFHWRAGRADVANWKDIPQDAAGIVAWRRVCRDLFEGVDEAGHWYTFYSLASQGTAKVADNAYRYGADFVLTERYPVLQLPVVYGNGSYTVYSAEAALPASGLRPPQTEPPAIPPPRQTEDTAP